MTSRGNKKGYTLIELLIVIAMVGILATMSYSYMISARVHQQLERAEIEVAVTLNRARHVAINNELTARVVFDTTSNTMQIDSFNRSTGAWDFVDGPISLPEGIILESTGLTLPDNEARFSPRGSLVWGGEIALQNASGETRVLAGNIASGRFDLGGGNLR